ncbi:MAG TPA: prepilin-type N-terminal cleavage/methylation domain-containing protein [Polyangia bacterium]|nr:prepilin-type N-terminal cleavage/methylation domain-containing protein [Polyangia bacterium]
MISKRQPEAARAARGRAAGFTLIEVMIAVGVLALVATIGVKGFRTVTKSNLRSSASHLSGAIRFLFDRASVTGKYHRLVIDLNEGKYWAEVSDDKFYAPNQAESVADRQKREDKEAAQDEADRKRKEKEDALYGKGGGNNLFSSYTASSSFDMSKLEVGDFHPKRPRFAAFKETALKPVTLNKLRIASVYTPRMTEPVTSGRAYIYFYPLGQTEPAIVTLTDASGENVYSLVVHPLTGRVRIYNQEVRPTLGTRYDDEGRQVVQ